MENPDLQSSAKRDMPFEPVVPDLEAGVNQMLQTPWDKIYAVSKNGKTYIGPSALGGVPVDKIDETGPYWDQSWQSLEEFLAREPIEEELKENYHERLRRLPGDKVLAAKAKFHMDNVSKHRKVREIFGNGSPYHPNQLASKHHLPHGGLCHKEIMYRLACKVSDLRELHNRRELRIVRKAQALVGASWESTRDVIKTVIYRICDDSGNEQAQKYEDRLLRMAVLRSAQYRDKLANYGSKNVIKPSFSTKKPSTRIQKTTSRPQQPVRHEHPRHEQSRHEQPRPSSQLQRERRERSASTIGYTGVNGFRQEQRIRAARPKSTSNERT
ncbi:hypothetical protein QQZ08_006172 [Neonectria magnoliae]|uniref:Uncharacterized protein n=1 Tax=Neonectria magnoliae TaxID=2732573 RepID=A0ABR1I1M6_9HYPO